MKHLYIALLGLFLFSCTKSTNNSNSNGTNSYIPYSDTLRILENIKLRTAIIKASPYDSVHNPIIDSIQVSYNRFVGQPDFLQNLNVAMIINSSFSFAIDPTNFMTSGNQIFILTYRMLPGVNAGAETNKVYENTYTGDQGSELFYLSMHSGNGIGIGRYFLSQDSIPPDGTSNPQVKIYCKLLFTKKYQVQRASGEVANLADGTISGYYEAHFGAVDYNKYVSSFSYQCDFQGVVIDK